MYKYIMESNMFYIVAIVIVLILVFGYYYYTQNSKSPDFVYKYLDGLWVGDEEFCKRADIEGMLVYILTTKDPKVKKASIIMYANNMVVENKVVILTFDESEKIDDYENISLELKIKQKGNKLEIMPKEQDVVLNMVTGKMVWKKDDTSYAELTKDNLSI
jgi:hypothetical protein